MRLSKNFTLRELTRTSAGIPNPFTDWEVDNLSRLCQRVLQPLRDAYGGPISVNSGYRSQMVNIAVGGAPESQHIKGEAADITAGSRGENKKLFEILKTMEFDQLITYDYRFLHVSYTVCRKNRKQIIYK